MPILPSKMITLVLGGTRSGKTAYAESLAVSEDEKKTIYIATAEPIDDEIKARIKQHQESRSPRFELVEEPHNIIEQLKKHDSNHILLIDSIGTWLTNHMMAGSDINKLIEETVSTLRETKASIVLVSEEVGMGIVPESQMAREFRDHIGRANQRIGQEADKIIMMVAGHPLTIKPTQERQR